ncbi:MAG: cobaltochelatase subunit CobN [Candidatus Bathyarchaeota archaeon]|nr:cobaltochelatase subunit CobN [Candidatus Bathyarchaeota archaeon]
MKQLKIALATTIPSDTIPFIEAVKTINQRYGDIVQARMWTGGDFRDFGSSSDFIQFAKTAHVTLVHLMGNLPELNTLEETLKSSGAPLLVASSVMGQEKESRSISTVEPEDYPKIYRYLTCGGKKNFENLILYAANRFTGASFEVNAPTPSYWEGLYHPDFEYVPELAEYVEKKILPNKITVGIWFHQSYWQGANTGFIDDLIREVEGQGANVLPAFFSGPRDPSLGVKGLEWVVDNYFMKDGKPIVDVVLNVLSFSLGTALSGGNVPDVLKKLDVPVIKAITTCNTFEEWSGTLQGLSLMDIPANIAMPEFDGALITVPIAAMDFSKTNPLTGTRIITFEPIPERITKLARLGINWGKLRKLPNSQKKVAIIFHNYPPRNDTIGHAFGLDSSVSVMNILRDLKEHGYQLEMPESSQKMMDTIINGLTNDRRWASSKELAERSLDKISRTQYAAWFSELPADVQEKMEKDWGKTPGNLFSYNGDLLIAGISTGNVFIGLQPPRGYLENPSSIYHSPDIAMPHHYYAYYRWIRDIFGANVIMHIGTHGSLEWLPGKSVGLSASCSSDITISDLPNIYPYVITNPGEGTQAKRRSYCCIIEHLVPAMHNADSYEELAALEVQLQEYYQDKAVDQAKLPVLQKLIWENVIQAKLDHDLNVTQDSAFADFDEFLEQLHGYINELSDAQIRDGLHTLGEPPVDLRLEEFMVTLTRLSNGSVPSLRQSLAEVKGYDYEDMLAHRGKLGSDGKTNGDKLKELNALSLELIQKFRAANYDEEKIDTLILDALGKSASKVHSCLSYVGAFLAPALASTTDEITYTTAASSAGYIPPGPSGSITRGMADILPTGRNFFSVDPRSVPTVASWQVGVALGDTLLNRYLKEEGKYPESVGIIIWATDTMKTRGDDIAEILYLMGVKPVWEQSSGRVVGVEAIPLETLKRPRVDVTIRMSGLFRDTFPNVVHLIDDAILRVAGLKEPAEQNFIAKHVETEVAQNVANGVDIETAREEAYYRIFGDRPGAYGCGVSEAIDAKNWKEQKDLSDIFVTWGSYAYSRKNYGRQVPEQFKARLSKINVTVKNQDSREYDILDGDDWYDSHGGMINAVKVLGGKAPRSFCGDSSDPDRVKAVSTTEETCHVFRFRLLNPKYIQSMVKHGYQGAADLSRTMDFVFGWDATVEVVEDWMYESLAEKYVLDKQMQEWLKEVNPYALQNMVERLLEAISRGMWNASEEMKKELQRLYLSVEGLLEEANEK